VWKIAVMIWGKRIRETFKTAEAATERAEITRNQYPLGIAPYNSLRRDWGLKIGVGLPRLREWMRM
jgi:hypothetical protein